MQANNLKGILPDSAYITTNKFKGYWFVKNEFISAIEEYNNSADSGFNKFFSLFLDDNGIEYEREYCVHYGKDKRYCYKYDFKIGNIFVEIDPSGTHNCNVGFKNHPDTAKAIDYHLKKSKTAWENRI